MGMQRGTGSSGTALPMRPAKQRRIAPRSSTPKPTALYRRAFAPRPSHICSVLGGFECSTHRRRDGKRLDLIQSTRHDELALSDYRLLQRHGIATARDGLRWHLIERTPGTYEFASATGMLDAARQADMQVIWDLWHYGWPD